MEFLGFVVLAVLVWVGIRLARRRSKGSESEFELPIEVSITTEYRGPGHDDRPIVDTGKITSEADGAYLINPKSPLPLTLTGLTKQEAQQFKKKLDGEARWERNLDDLTFLVAQHNVQCVELDEYLAATRTQVQQAIDTEIGVSTEWNDASERDRRDIVLSRPGPGGLFHLGG